MFRLRDPSFIKGGEGEVEPLRPQALWSQLYTCSHLLASTPPGLPFQGTSPLTAASPPTGGERRSEGAPSRHGAAQRLAFAYKGEGYGRHCICEPSIGACPTYVAAASHAARFEISYLQRLTLPGGAMRWRSYRRGGMTWAANWHCGVNTNVANCRTGS